MKKALFALGVILASFAGMSAMAQQVGTIKVAGKGEVSVAPNTVTLSMSVESRDKDYTACVTNLNEQTEALKKALRKVGFNEKDILTTNYNVRRETRYNNQSRRSDFIGYLATHYLKVSFPFDKSRLNKAVNALSAKAGQASFNIAFSVSDTEALKAQLAKSAVTDATKKAEALAQAAGLKLGYIQSIEYGNIPVRYSNAGYQFDAEVSMMRKSESAVADINPEDVKNTADVTVVWVVTKAD
ncbi:hypothetical protein FUAX_42250 (plasmid) [Fulvitalea axinellae]|uniref:DUF541 domain-containing protein n=1 Tax=Fulvitalea axinellae TaxID=1182444 RepID=A0AAU9CUR3_9BACT|nr:hypothetical protein FUAX_42250 [Fulvitalea axinellae]